MRQIPFVEAAGAPAEWNSSNRSRPQLHGLQLCGHAPEPIERRLQVCHDLGRDLIGRRQKVGVVEQVKKARSGDPYVDTLLFTQFADKITILKKRQQFAWSRTQFEKELNRVQLLRDSVAHANDYAATRDAACGVCKTVRSMDTWIGLLAKDVPGVAGARRSYAFAPRSASNSSPFRSYFGNTLHCRNTRKNGCVM